jgi:hypothetical protein
MIIRKNRYLFVNKLSILAHTLRFHLQANDTIRHELDAWNILVWDMGERPNPGGKNQRADGAKFDVLKKSSQL